MEQKSWLKEPNKKKKKRKSNEPMEDILKLGVGMIGLGIGLHALHDMTD
jgi:hypothetical protein